MKKNLFNIRRDYKFSELSVESMPDNPFEVFKEWIDEAITMKKNAEPTAMVLATAGLDYKVTSRVVLLKKFDLAGFYFFTNYDSKKGRQLKENPNAALLFFWPEMERQIRIEGTILPASDITSDKYFSTRPFESQVSAIVSPQSKPIENRAFLEKQGAKYYSDTAKKKLQRPDNWGGYYLSPVQFEFWQGRPNRLHDRIEFRLEANKWSRYRLAP